MNAKASQIILASQREARDAQIQQAFPGAAGPALTESWRGGRAAALARLSVIDAVSYSRTRNHLQGAVTKLSPFLRHGCLSLQETLQSILSSHGRAASKLVSELAYRDYFRQVWYRFGKDILSDMETPKVKPGSHPLPEYVKQGFTGLVCMDEIVRQLQLSGYVHNHARMWLAAYILHWLKVDWLDAADWFESHLLDGDIASNHLSWQWIGSSFSNKPYYFNRDNLQQFGGQHWCERCLVRCPFNQDYLSLQQQLFEPASISAEPQPLTRMQSAAQQLPSSAIHTAFEQTSTNAKTPHDTLVWLHDEMLSPTQPLLHAGQPAVFVFDPQRYARWPLKRLQFMADCLAEMPDVMVWHGNTRRVLQSMGAARIVSMHTPQTVLRQAVHALNIDWQAEPALYDVTLENHDLMRFSRYWKKVAPQLMAGF